MEESDLNDDPVFSGIVDLLPPLTAAAREVEEWRKSGKHVARRAVDLNHYTSCVGCFVTWRRIEDRALRGCLGVCREEPLADLVTSAAEMAIAAATRDPRFPPIAPDEFPVLQMTLTVIGAECYWAPPRESSALRIGCEGIRVCRGKQEGLLLPQVAIEWGLDGRGFLEACCNKAGLGDDAWREENVEIYRFPGKECAARYGDLVGLAV